jgi:hypothetical protein
MALSTKKSLAGLGLDESSTSMILRADSSVAANRMACLLRVPSKANVLSVEDEQRIFEAAPPYLRVVTILLVQTGERTYSE